MSIFTLNSSFELHRRIFVGVLAFMGFGAVALGVLRGGTGSRFGMDAWHSGHLELWYARYGWVFVVLWLVGLLALFVLSVSFVFVDKRELHRRGLAWWLLLLPLCVLVLVAIGGRFLPFVDLFSPTDLFFRELGYYAVYGRGFVVWLVIALLLERSHTWSDAPDEAAPAGEYTGAALALGVAVFVSVCTVEWVANTPENRNMSSTSEAGNGFAWARHRKALVCANTHAIVGKARDFEVVREPYCWAYNDTAPSDKPDTLQRCQSVQFKVDVLAQYSPWQKDLVPRSVQTLRVSGIHSPLSDIKAELEGNPSQWGLAVQDIKAPKPRLFLAKADRVDGIEILRGASRGNQGMSLDVPKHFPELAENPLAICSGYQKRVEEVRTQCPWDYAVHARVTSFKFIPGQPEFKGSYYVFPAASSAEKVAEVLRRQTSPEPGEMLEVSFELVQDLMLEAKRFAPPPKTFKVRVNVNSDASPEQTREHINRNGIGNRSGRMVLHLRADKKETDVFHLVDPKRHAPEGYLSNSHIDIQLRDAKRVNAQCQAARDALD